MSRSYMRRVRRIGRATDNLFWAWWKSITGPNELQAPLTKKEQAALDESKARQRAKEKLARELSDRESQRSKARWHEIQRERLERSPENTHRPDSNQES